MHRPVLLKEVIRLTAPKQGEFFIDGTLNGGGYAVEILKKILPGGKLLGIDWDKDMLIKARQEIVGHQSPITDYQLLCSNFANLPEILKRKNLGKADGLVLDLGFSGEQLEKSGRGFSFRKDEPLIMTYSRKMAPAREILKKLGEQELAEIIKNLSQERFAGRIARAIKEQQKINPIETTKELVRVIARAVPKNYESGRMHPAVRTFLALRMYVNSELENLEKVLKNLNNILKPGGRAAIVSFQSMEDRLVKNYFRDLSKAGKLEILTKKPIIPTRDEIKNNPKSRSAKLRSARLL